MSDIWSALQWWQLRILVLSSLSFQWFLVLLIPLRNYTVQRWVRACIWLACICANVLAIYALATLLYRQAAGGRWFDDYGMAQQWRSLPLEALWAPLLLVHLGGREELAVTGVDDDDDTALWVRHAAVLVTVTVYAFFTSLRNFSDSSDGFKLLASAALLLVAAVVSSVAKPWVLRRASVRRLLAKSSMAKGARKTKTKTKTSSIGCWEWCFTELGDRYKCWKELKPRGTAPMLSQGDKVQMLLSGMSLHAARATMETRKKKPEQKILEPLKPWRRRELQDDEAGLDPPEVDKIIKPWLRRAFGLIYTREAAMFTPAYLACHALLVPSLYVAAVVLLFAASHHHKKHGYSSRYSRADVNTTYALLCLTAALDVFGMFVSEMVHWLLSSSSAAAAACENLPGHNLMDSVLWTIRRPIVSMLLLRCYKGGCLLKDKDLLYGRVLNIIRDKVQEKDTIILKEEDNTTNRVEDRENKEDKDKDKNKDDKVQDKDNSTNMVEDQDQEQDQDKDRNKDSRVEDKENSKNKVEDKDKEDKDDKVEDKDNSTNMVEDQDQDKNKDSRVEDKENSKNKVEDKDKRNKDGIDTDKDFDLDLSSYRSLSKRNWILRDKDLKLVGGNKCQNIRDSLRKKPFDASVLIWHIATDLCFRVKPPGYFRFRPWRKEVVREVCTEAISNYMAYLLDSWPEMLMAGTRQHLFAEAMANMERVVREATKGLRPKLREKQPLDEVILGEIKKEAARLKQNEAYTVIDDACKLAEELLGMEEKSRWELMHRVWVGMLCYSASMCRSDLHAKSLGKGGEFLSNVWLLISLIGGRTLADKLQMADDDPEQEDMMAVDPARDDKGEKREEPEAGDKVLQTPDSESKDKRRSKAAELLRQGFDAGARARARG